jgi:hypothetical protein
MALWSNLSERTATYIRPGGAGNRWTLFDENGAMVDGPTGGAADVESRFGLDSKGRRVYLGAIKQGDAARFTTTISARVELARLVTQLRKGDCPFDMMEIQRCGDLAALDLSFSPIEDAAIKLVHKDITGTVSDFDINKVISVGIPRCSGDCSIIGANDGEQDFWAVTDADTTPGHGGFSAPRFLYTEDGGTNWNGSSVTVLLGGNLFGVAKAGDYAIVAGSTGIAYAKFQDIKDGVSLPWTLALSASNINDQRHAVRLREFGHHLQIDGRRLYVVSVEQRRTDRAEPQQYLVCGQHHRLLRWQHRRAGAVFQRHVVADGRAYFRRRRCDYREFQHCVECA